jgi:hypothetical protein
MSPVVASPAFCLIYSLNFVLNIGWVFSWDREMLVTSSYILWGMVITNIVAMTILIQNIEKENHQLKEEQPTIYWTYIILVFNGQGTYTAWTIIAGLINFTECLIYDDIINMQSAVTVYLSLLLIIAVSWAVLDWIFLDNFARFLITPYLVAVWALGGTISKKSSDPEVSEFTKNFLIGLIVVASALFAVKISFLIFRQLKKPFNGDN